MTRTERSHSLRALIKDRSLARNGMDMSNDAFADEAGETEDQAQESGGERFH